MIKMTFLQRPQKRLCRLIKFLKVDDAIVVPLCFEMKGKADAKKTVLNARTYISRSYIVNFGLMMTILV